ncbi:MAG: 50S ribosomal protein L11 methyltransferase [Candidatus Thorarchaeota archaeon SMTZ1-83]
MADKEYATPFSLLHAARLLSHRSRLAKFEEALRRTVREDSYVVDIGSGTGVLALMAAKAGARRVTGLEVQAESVEYARKAAKKNLFSDIVEFKRVHFADFTPEERADVVICEMLSAIMLIEQQVPASRHAVKEILAPDGVLLPHHVSVYVVPVECYAIQDRFSIGNLQFQALPQTVDSGNVRDLSDLAILTQFDLTRVRNGEHVDAEIEFEILENGVVHGLVGMFEAQLYEDIVLRMDDGWRNLFLPLAEPIEVAKGDILRIGVKYTPGRYDSFSMRRL